LRSSFAVHAQLSGCERVAFKSNEKSIRDRLERIDAESGGVFVFEDTAVLQQVRRVKTVSPDHLLERIYKKRIKHN
jgi:hypothetical protein